MLGGGKGHPVIKKSDWPAFPLEGIKVKGPDDHRIDTSSDGVCLKQAILLAGSLLTGARTS